MMATTSLAAEAAPPGARLVEELDGSVVVEIDGPWTDATLRDGPDFCMTIVVPHDLVVIAEAKEELRWLMVVLIGYVTHVGTGSNTATAAELIYSDGSTGRVTNKRIADGVVRRFAGISAVKRGNVMRLLTELCAPP